MHAHVHAHSVIAGMHMWLRGATSCNDASSSPCESRGFISTLHPLAPVRRAARSGRA